MPKIGDIVSVTQYPGEKWVVMSRHEHGVPAERLWRLWRETDKHSITRIVGDGDMTVIEHPTFSPGQRVKYWGGTAEVIADLGEIVCIRLTRFRPRSLDREDRTRTEQVVGVDANRGQLVAFNL